MSDITEPRFDRPRCKQVVISELKLEVIAWMDQGLYLLAQRSVEALREIAPLNRRQWLTHPLSYPREPSEEGLFIRVE